MTSSGGHALDPAALRDLLDELVRRLEARGVTGSIRIVGGAALALRYPDDPDVRVTRDIDAVWEPRSEVAESIAELASDRGLEVEWINSAGAPWLRTDTPEPRRGEFLVVVATPEQLVAMKLAAGRSQDVADLRILARHLGIRDPAGLVDIAYRVYGDDAVELPDGRDSYLLLARDVIDSL